MHTWWVLSRGAVVHGWCKGEIVFLSGLLPLWSQAGEVAGSLGTVLRTEDWGLEVSLHPDSAPCLSLHFHP